MNALNICNSAILKLGGKALTTLADRTVECDVIRAQYPHIRDMVLRSHVWKFAKAIAALEPLADAFLPSPWGYAFQLPDDCLRILSVDTDSYEIAGRIVYSNQEALVLRYVQQGDPILGRFEYPADFGETLACYLAGECSMKITQDPAMRGSYLQQYADLLRQARFNGAVEGPALTVVADEWLAGRDISAGIDARDLDLP